MTNIKQLPALILGLFCFALPAMVSAQLSIGLKGGIATESLQEERFDLSRTGREDLRFALKEANYGFQFGAFLRIPLSDRFDLVPEVTFNSSGTEYTLTDDNDPTASDVFKERYNDINVPILASWKLAFLRLQAGPVGHFTVSSASDLTDPDGRERTFDSFNLGYTLGGALDIGPIVLDLRYDGNFAKYGDTFTVAGEDLSINQAPRRWIATVGYKF